MRRLVLVLAVAASLAACSVTDAGTGPGIDPAGVSTPAAPSTVAGAGGGVERVRLTTALDHVHGLVVDADGALLAGTHTGTVRVQATGGTSRLGPGDDDLMGMTGVPGTGRLISSGHPGPSSTMPNPLGLLSSQDGGQSWTAMSLAGEVDFHALATDGQVIAGFDGINGIRISRDGGRTWAAGAPVAAVALAMTPDGLWAGTEQGLQRSADDGRSFTAVPGAPVLALLTSGTDHSLWGVDIAGDAWRSRDGTVWERRGPVGQVQALAARDHATAYAVTTDQLHILT